MTIRLISLHYGEQIGDCGAYDHPDGETCALYVGHVMEFLDEHEDDAFANGIMLEEDRMVHQVILEVV